MAKCRRVFRHPLAGEEFAGILSVYNLPTSPRLRDSIAWSARRAERRDPVANINGKRLEKAPGEQAEALHNAGILELLRGALTGKGKMMEEAVATANPTEGINAIRNAITFGKMISSINPERSWNPARWQPAKPWAAKRMSVIEPPSLFSLLAQFCGKHLHRSVALINRFWESQGSQLKLTGSPTSKD